MRIVEITASFGATKQVRQYEPVNFHASVKAEIDEETEDLEKSFRTLFDEAKRQIREQIKTLNYQQ